MKQCPACNETFDDGVAFCDLDGTQLLDPEDVLRAALVEDLQSEEKPDKGQVWVIGLAGVFVGVILCLIFYIATMPPDSKIEPRAKNPEPQIQPASSMSRQIASAPLPTVSPLDATAEASPEDPEQDNPEQAAPSPVVSTPKVSSNLNEERVSTGEKGTESKHAVIVMKDGTSVEADAAWQDAQGVWYRRSGLVSFVELSRVERITEPSQPKPAANEPAKP